MQRSKMPTNAFKYVNNFEESFYVIQRDKNKVKTVENA